MNAPNEIAGFPSDGTVRVTLADISSDLSPIEDTSGRMMYAQVLLNWVMIGETVHQRKARFNSIERVHSDWVHDLRRESLGESSRLPVEELLAKAEIVFSFLGEGT